jgi:hypothetical protein
MSLLVDPELEQGDAHVVCSHDTTARAVASALGCCCSHEVTHVWSLQLPVQAKNATHSLSFAHPA